MKLLTKLPSHAPRPGCGFTQLGRLSLPLAVTLLLGTALVLRVAVPLGSSLMREPQASSPSMPASLARVDAQPDLAGLQALGLFTAAEAGGPAATPLPAMNTALNLRLEGVMMSGDATNNQAVILSGERRGSYRAGDELPAGANIKVASIARDHVVIDNRGQREVLWLFDQHGATSSGTTAREGMLAGTVAAGLVPPPGTEERVLKTAARLAEIISVAPEVVNGQLAGYRLTPGARLKDFVQLGFQTNDIVTAVNGIALNDMANLPQLYSLMDGATEVSFSLLRDGAPLNLKVTLAPETAGSPRE